VESGYWIEHAAWPYPSSDGRISILKAPLKKRCRTVDPGKLLTGIISSLIQNAA
jgi:hypothetical protein